MSDSVEPYDALLLLSFGGPEQPGDVVPFLENVTAGRGIPRERLEQVGEHYFAFGGRSPINDQNRTLLAALRQELTGRGVDLPVYWGNRNWQPFVVDALREAHEAGARRVLTLVTSAYASYSGCRQYREDLAAALIRLADEGRELGVDKVRHYYNSPGFVEQMTRSVLDSIASLPRDVRDQPHLAFVTHSIPTAMNDSSGPQGGQYESQHLDVAREVARRVADVTGRELPWRLVYCSRSGPPSQPWLEPDVNDHLRVLHAGGAAAAVVVPIGFVSDHMEVKYDLDTEASETARELRLPFVRAATVGTAPAFVAALVDLVIERAALERAAGEPGEAALPRPTAGDAGPSHDVCPVGCCPNPRVDRPAACGADWSGPRTLSSTRTPG